ncbi:flagellar motor switch protein FliG [Thioclava sp. ES.031]|uniref:flagellar motor switch protein FliG n=1 Tax=Thioclava sp. ES.031 TaxID=1798203 RepID=UPI000BF33F3A|nr:flagellar motor switch protein FliG [Thioclava sp. ES.031]PFG61893.1 flagellar motor switch protein FliG [Thioclava sp. ES.031]
MKTSRDYKKLRGPEKAAILFLCLGEKHGAGLMQRLDDYDIHSITHAISSLGTIPADVVEEVMSEFMETAGDGGGIVGSMEMAQSMLKGFLPEDRVTDIMHEIQGPLVGRNIWENFSALNEQVIANYLKDEHDQTVAAILSKVKPEVASKVLPLLGEERMMEVLERMIGIDTVPRYVFQNIEETLQKEFMSSATRNTGPDPQQRMADLFNKLDSKLFDDITQRLETRIPEAFGAIKAKMFTFDDLCKLDQQSLVKVMRGVEGQTLPLALRGAKKEVRDYFLSALPSRSRDMLNEEMTAMGPVRGREVQEAQSALVDYALELSRDDEIRIPLDDDDVIID